MLEAVEVASRQLESSLKQSAKSLRDKYLVPPATTDFGIIFLPTEGPYAEALRRAGLARVCPARVPGCIGRTHNTARLS